MRDLSTVCIPPSLERACWLIVILSVVTVFLLPCGFGPYTAVNGPTTVFKSIQHADAVKELASAAVLLDIRPLVSSIHVLRTGTPPISSFEGIDILEKYCVRLC